MSKFPSTFQKALDARQRMQLFIQSVVVRVFLLGREFPTSLVCHLTALFMFCNMFGNCVKLTLEVSINLSSKQKEKRKKEEVLFTPELSLA